MVLLRHLLGDALRRMRLRQGRTLREVSASARVSLGYLSEVERGQKEASSELLAAICSALGTPLSQVLREVSDNFALAELQSEPVYVDVLEPAIEVAGVGHAPRRHDASGEPAGVGSGPVASVHGHGHGHEPAGRRVSIPATTRVPATVGGLGAGQLSAGSITPATLGQARLAAGRLTAGRLAAGQLAKTRPISAAPEGAALPLGVVGDPVFDQVARTARQINNMVPV